MSIIKVKRTIRPNPKVSSAAEPPLRPGTRAHLAREDRRQLAIETILFVVIAAVSAWPLITAAETVCTFLQTAAG